MHENINGFYNCKNKMHENINGFYHKETTHSQKRINVKL
jgi:hypothetical protein